MPPTNQQDAELIRNLGLIGLFLNENGSPGWADDVKSAIARIQSQPAATGVEWVKKGAKPLSFPCYFWQDDCTDGRPLWLCIDRADCELFMTHFMPIKLPTPPPREPSAEEAQAAEDKRRAESSLGNDHGMDGEQASIWKRGYIAALSESRASARRAT